MGAVFICNDMNCIHTHTRIYIYICTVCTGCQCLTPGELSVILYMLLCLLYSTNNNNKNDSLRWSLKHKLLIWSFFLFRRKENCHYVVTACVRNGAYSLKICLINPCGCAAETRKSPEWGQTENWTKDETTYWLTTERKKLQNFKGGHKNTSNLLEINFDVGCWMVELLDMQYSLSC